MSFNSHYDSQFVSYSCGSCGWELNLNSTDRNTTNIDSKYHKAIKKGIVSFNAIDESRFSQVDGLQCHPYFNSRQSWGLFRKKSKLFCRKCRNFIGVGYEDVSSPTGSYSPESSSVDSPTSSKKYNIKINALQPMSVTSSNQSGIRLSI